MILKEIDNLIKYVQLKAATTTSFGDIDLGVDDYPHISIIPISNINIVEASSDDNYVGFQLNIKITVSRKNERDAIAILEKLLNSLPQFGCGKHMIGESGTAEYTQNTYTITLQYLIKSIIGV